MEWIGLLVVAVVIATGIVLISRRWRDRPEDRGPYSTAIEARAGLAGLGHTLDVAPGDRDDASEAARPDHD